MRDKQKRKEKDRRSLNNLLIDIYRDWWKRSEPFSDTWTDCYNKLQYQLYLHDEYDKEHCAFSDFDSGQDRHRADIL